MRGAHELRFSLEMALAANFDLRPLVKERSFVIDLGKLEPVARFLHDGMTVGATAVEEEPGIATPRGAGMLRVCVTFGA